VIFWTMKTRTATQTELKKPPTARKRLRLKKDAAEYREEGKLFLGKEGGRERTKLYELVRKWPNVRATTWQQRRGGNEGEKREGSEGALKKRQQEEKGGASI